LHRAEPVPYAHRDIKPHNVLLEEGKRSKDDVELIPILMDLGSVAPARVKVRSHR
jgi:serine/threonine protein kinase